MKRILLFWLLSCLCLSTAAQELIPGEQQILNGFLASYKADDLPKGASKKTIDFPTQKYAVTGFFTKGALTEGQCVEFYDNSDLPCLILEGKVSYLAGRLVITGVKYDKVASGSNRTYGVFQVSNTPEQQMIYKPKKAGEISIRVLSLNYFIEADPESPTLVTAGDNPSIIVNYAYKDTSAPVLRAPLPNNSVTLENYSDTANLLTLVNNNAKLTWGNGDTFDGSLQPIKREDGKISFNKLAGKLTQKGSGAKSLQVIEGDKDIRYVVMEDPATPKLYSETIIVDDKSLIPIDSLWNPFEYYKNCSSVVFVFWGGKTFTGQATCTPEYDDSGKVVSYSRQLTEGTLKYPNGEYFIGNLSGKVSNGFPVDGTTYFKDGKQVKGDWLKGYKLTKEQWGVIALCDSPSSAIMAAEGYEYENTHIEYKIKDGIERVTLICFHPLKGYHTNVYDIGGMIYDKTERTYTFKNLWGHTQLIVKTNNAGYHTEEIVYSKRDPAYINKLEWYPDGTLKKAMVYHYKTGLLYIVCNYFSDGTLRSAYEYRDVDGHSVALRKSKESHPSFPGSYTCKLYDFNGQYERAIEWEIGEDDGIFSSGPVKVQLPPLPVNEFDKGTTQFEKGKFKYRTENVIYF